jgi:hypothetical protein
MRGLTLGNASVNEIIASTRHFRHSDGRHRVSCVPVFCFYLFPGYLCVACGGSYRVRVSFRSIDLRLREVCLERANPLVAPSGWGQEAKMSGDIPLDHHSARKGYVLFKPPCCQLLLYMMSAWSVIFPWSGMSSVANPTLDAATSGHLTLTRTDNGDVKRRLEVPALHLNKAKHQTTQPLDLLKCCGVIDIKGKGFRHLARNIRESIV